MYALNKRVTPAALSTISEHDYVISRLIADKACLRQECLRTWSPSLPPPPLNGSENYIVSRLEIIGYHFTVNHGILRKLRDITARNCSF